MVVVGIGTMALIIVLSVFNGLEGLLKSTYGNFDPEIIITPKIGKSFIYPDTLSQKVRSIEAVDLVGDVVARDLLGVDVVVDDVRSGHQRQAHLALREHPLVVLVHHPGVLAVRPVQLATSSWPQALHAWHRWQSQLETYPARANPDP